jgi:2,4'-dihydroxyacetophenone dioxygenase
MRKTESEKINAPDDRRVPYQLPHPAEAQTEIIIPTAMPADDRVWVPQM